MPVRLSPLEIASGLVLGEDPGAPPLPEADPGLTPLAALERAVVGALERPPCLVSFSGGRDSSGILALAVRVAGREGLEPPVPITVRFAAPEAAETGWQDRVIGELGVADWLRVNAGEELGVLGPVARSALERHGLLWPPNVHVLAPLLEAAAGGTLVTGVGGDEVLGGASRLRRAFLPHWVRRLRARRYPGPELPWLRDEARAALARAAAEEQASEPGTWRSCIHWVARRRSLGVLRAGAAALAAERSARIIHPLMEPSFIAVLAERGSRRRFATRTDSLREVFGDVVSDGVLGRADKARFTRALWGAEAREFARRRNGACPVASLVDSDRIRDEWRRDRPDFRSATALQAAWLAEERASLAPAVRGTESTTAASG